MHSPPQTVVHLSIIINNSEHDLWSNSFEKLFTESSVHRTGKVLLVSSMKTMILKKWCLWGIGWSHRWPAYRLTYVFCRPANRRYILCPNLTDFYDANLWSDFFIRFFQSHCYSKNKYCSHCLTSEVFFTMRTNTGFHWVSLDSLSVGFFKNISINDWKSFANFFDRKTLSFSRSELFFDSLLTGCSIAEPNIW